MKHNSEQYRWIIKGMTDAAARAGVTTQAPDARQIADAKRDYQEMTLHERINRRGGK